MLSMDSHQSRYRPPSPQEHPHLHPQQQDYTPHTQQQDYKPHPQQQDYTPHHDGQHQPPPPPPPMNSSPNPHPNHISHPNSHHHPHHQSQIPSQASSHPPYPPSPSYFPHPQQYHPSGSPPIQGGPCPDSTQYYTHNPHQQPPPPQANHRIAPSDRYPDRYPYQHHPPQGPPPPPPPPSHSHGHPQQPPRMQMYREPAPPPGAGHPLLSSAIPPRHHHPQNHPQNHLLGMESYYGCVRSPQDAILLFEACRIGRLHRVQRRLTDNERQLIRAGSVFIWDEIEAGMRRWTDGKSWSASRVSGSFLTYREMEGRKPNSGSSFQPTAVRRGLKRSLEEEVEDDQSQQADESAPDGYRYKIDGLVKQSFSITTKQGIRLHLISYFTRRDADSEQLPVPSTDSLLSDINPLNGLYPESATNEASIPFSPGQPGPPNLSPAGGHPHRMPHPPPSRMPHGPPAPAFSYPGYPHPSAWPAPHHPPPHHPTSYPSSHRGNSSPTPGHHYAPSPVSFTHGMSKPSSRPASVHGGDFSRSVFSSGPLPPLRSPLDSVHSGMSHSGGSPNQFLPPTSHPSSTASAIPRTRPYSTIEPVIPRSPVMRPPRRTPTLSNVTPRRSNSSKLPAYRSTNSPSQYSYAPYPELPRRTVSPQGIRPGSSGAPLPGIRALLNDENKFGVSPSPSARSPTTSSDVKRVLDGHSVVNSPETLYMTTDRTPSAPPSRPISGVFRNTLPGTSMQLPRPGSARGGDDSLNPNSRSLPPLMDEHSGNPSYHTNTNLSRLSSMAVSDHSSVSSKKDQEPEKDLNWSSSWRPAEPAYPLPPLNPAPAFTRSH